MKMEKQTKAHSHAEILSTFPERNHVTIFKIAQLNKRKMAFCMFLTLACMNVNLLNGFVSPVFMHHLAFCQPTWGTERGGGMLENGWNRTREILVTPCISQTCHSCLVSFSQFCIFFFSFKGILFLSSSFCIYALEQVETCCRQYNCLLSNVENMLLNGS